MKTKPPFELEDLLPLIPHRPPFLFVDRVTVLDPFQRIVAERALRPEEPHFAGHFPGHAIMPGVLVAEALAQASGLLLGLSEACEAAAPPDPPTMFYLATTSIKYTHPAKPCEVLILRAQVSRLLGDLCLFNVEATVGRHPIASGSLTLARVKGRP